MALKEKQVKSGSITNILGAIAAIISAAVAVAMYIPTLNKPDGSVEFNANKRSQPTTLADRADTPGTHSKPIVNNGKPIDQAPDVRTGPQQPLPSFDIYTKGALSYLVSDFINTTGNTSNNKYLVPLSHELKKQLGKSDFVIREGDKSDASHSLAGEIISVVEMWDEDTVRVVMNVSLDIEKPGGATIPRYLKADVVLYKNQYSLAPDRISEKVISLLDLSAL